METESKVTRKFIYKDFSDLLPAQEQDSVVALDSDGQESESNEYADLFKQLDENGYTHEQPSDSTPEEKPIEIDIEQIKLEKYEEGYKKAKEEFEALLAQKEAEDLVFANLTEKLNTLNITEEVTKNIALEVEEIIKTILNQLSKTLPTNFAKLFEENFISIIQHGISLGNIEIRTHSSKKEIAAKIIAEQLKDNISRIKLLEDDNLNTDDIKIDYGNGQFQYKDEEITAAIDRIISSNLNPE
jgi:hypothetical protein